MNAPALATAPADRAWPLYRRALLTLPVHGAERPSDAALARLPRLNTATGVALADDERERFLRFLDTRPHHRLWPHLVRWLDGHADTVPAGPRDVGAEPRGANLGVRVGTAGVAAGRVQPVVPVPARLRSQPVRRADRHR